MSLCTRLPATGADTPSQKPCIGDTHTRSSHFRRLFGALAVPTSWYSASSPGGSPDKLILHQLARRAFSELILHQLTRRALGKLALYQLSGSWQAGIFLPACQEATLVNWYGIYQLARRHSQQAGTLPALQEVLPARWYCTSLPGGSPNELVLISAHQESPEYSAPACWGSAGKRFCRVPVGSQKVPTDGCWVPDDIFTAAQTCPKTRQVTGTRQAAPAHFDPGYIHPGVQTPACRTPSARCPHAYKWREDGRLGVRPRRTGVLAMHACPARLT
ncbi:hypothetical protein PCASD_04005 [Puccinia coronata f. sp. avenae]|uniref:Uncharacterized protein n=1 Tax=Puccinia coronata f. sp. avenae TaxID=200324 RepID=A0A2N5V5E0_9BASI|nr:hypothetical protein PCASD_04005 [Puccinia coronata f. sp. avenae]